MFAPLFFPLRKLINDDMLPKCIFNMCLYIFVIFVRWWTNLVRAVIVLQNTGRSKSISYFLVFHFPCSGHQITDSVNSIATFFSFSPFLPFRWFSTKQMWLKCLHAFIFTLVFVLVFVFVVVIAKICLFGWRWTVCVCVCICLCMAMPDDSKYC